MSSKILICLVFFSAIFFVLGNEWALDSATTATIVVGVGSSDSSTIKGVAAASANGVGAFVETFDGSSWQKQTLPGALLLDGAASKSGKLRVITSTGKVFLSSDFGQSYDSVDGIFGTSQSANIFGADKESIALVGGWVSKYSSLNSSLGVGSVNGVAFSSDGGKSFSLSSVPVGYTRSVIFLQRYIHNL